MSIHIEKIPAPAGQSFRLLRWRDNVKDIEECDAVGGTHPVEGAGEHWHLHREMELTFVESGRGLRLVGDNIARFSGPEIVLLGSRLPHCWHGLKRSTGFSVQFHWPAEHPLRVLPEFAALGPLWPRAGRGLLFSASLCDELRGRFEAMLHLSAPARLGVLLEVLGRLAAEAPADVRELSTRDLTVREDAQHQQGIERVIRRVLERYEESQPLPELLRLAGMSKATFARQFPRYTGATFTEFLNRVRLDHARQRIIVGGEAISAAAFGVGFNHLSHFNRYYRRQFGVTPREDRARCASV